MHHSQAYSLVNWYTNPRLSDTPFRPTVNFISPVVSAVLAAGSVNYRQLREVKLSTDAASYANTNGLAEVLAGSVNPVGNVSHNHGRTYSKLTRLTTHSEVEGCNSIVGDLFYEQLSSD
jgi:hypothetical protein